jgi:hypothetical protein
MNRLLPSETNDLAGIGREWTNRIMEWDGECLIIMDRKSYTTEDM